MLIVLIIIAILLVELIRIGYKVCANQVAAQNRTEQLLRAINSALTSGDKPF